MSSQSARDSPQEDRWVSNAPRSCTRTRLTPRRRLVSQRYAPVGASHTPQSVQRKTTSRQREVYETCQARLTRETATRVPCTAAGDGTPGRETCALTSQRGASTLAWVPQSPSRRSCAGSFPACRAPPSFSLFIRFAAGGAALMPGPPVLLKFGGKDKGSCEGTEKDRGQSGLRQVLFS